MDKSAPDYLSDIFDSPPAHRSKRMSLAEAINRHVKPKSVVDVSTNASAALREMARQLKGRNARITLITIAANEFSAILVHEGIVKKLITTSVASAYPVAGPLALIQEAYESGVLELERWSVFTLWLRLMAGAWGLPFLPTRSLVGSDLAAENSANFSLCADPFGGPDAIGAVRALIPDVAIIHACYADVYGNAILPVPYTGNDWSPFAAQRGTIVTAERIVPHDFITEHSSLVGVPAHLVAAVCEVPLGAHPMSMTHANLSGFEAYGADHEFSIELNRAQSDRNADVLTAWIDDWIVGPADQQDYLRKLGGAQIAQLKDSARPGEWERSLRESENQLPASAQHSANEAMVVTAGRIIKDIVLRKEYATILVGAGTPGIAAWLAYYLLRGAGREIDLLVGSGMVGFMPRPGDPWLLSVANFQTASMMADFGVVYGALVAGSNSKCLSVLGCIQIDKSGNINTSQIEERGRVKLMVGSGGANDATNATETIVITQQSPRKLVERVDYVTCPGDRVSTLVTDLGVFSKSAQGELVPERWISGQGIANHRDAISRMRERCGWTLPADFPLERSAPPSEDELAIVRSFDPRLQLLG